SPDGSPETPAAGGDTAPAPLLCLLWCRAAACGRRSRPRTVRRTARSLRVPEPLRCCGARRRSLARLLRRTSLPRVLSCWGHPLGRRLGCRSVPVGEEPQCGVRCRTRVGGVDDQRLVLVATRVQCLVANG